MSFKSAESVISSTKLNSDEFQMVSALGSFISNNNFQSGFVDYQHGRPTHEAFIYQVLSAVGNDLGSTIYDNVKRYVDYVSDVDICKIRALRSMLQLFDFKNTILDCVESLPLEIVNLLDVVSIDKKRLLKAGFLKPEFLARVIEDGSVLSQDDIVLDMNKTFQHGSLILSCDCFCTADGIAQIPSSFKKMCQMYSQLNYSSTSAYIEQTFSSDQDLSAKILAANETTAAELLSAKIYVNDYSYSIWKTAKNAVVYDHDWDPIARLDPAALDELSANGMTNQDLAISDLVASIDSAPASGLYSKDVLLSLKNQASRLKIIYKNLRFTEDPTRVDEIKYEAFLCSMFEVVLSSMLALKYNFISNKNGHMLEYCIYPDLGQEYYQKLNQSIDFAGANDDGFASQILELKKLNHIQKSFDEKTIANAIDVGDDSTDNYSGAELSVIQLEFKRRNAPASAQAISKFSGNLVPSQQNATRGTYYRQRKVLEYANFIDNYFAQVQQDGDIYAYDPNYFEVSDEQDVKCVINSSNPSGNPAEDFNYQMIGEVASYLAKLAIYINRIREKIKLQARKNYMKGTNLLLIYVINEWLVDYGRHNAKKFLEDPKLSSESILSGFKDIFSSLSSHQFSTIPGSYTINIDENYDETEYFNIQTRTSHMAQCSADTNERFWEKTTADSPEMLKGDGLQYKIADIEKFYLSTLGLQNPLSTVGSTLQEFLSTIYDLGANDSFMYKDPESLSSIFSSTLSSGETAADLFTRLVKLSDDWASFNLYLPEEDGYEWPADVLSNQISNVLETKIFADLSAKYLVDLSTIYDTHISTLESISSAMGQLSSDYNTFISSDYSYYFKKFENCKYCYDNYDIEAGQYLCPYYKDNLTYDDELFNLYEHLHQLEVYSVESNIQNWSLLCTMYYVRDELSSLSSETLEITKQLAEDYGFVDIGAITLDSELKYVYDYLSSSIESRKQFLLDQLKMLQTQATNCKTQYETLNNTFTTAIASFNDGHDGYTLGDSSVRWISSEKGEGGSAKYAEKRPSKSKWEWALYVPDPGFECWFVGPADGKYNFTGTTSVTPYNPDDGILQRIAAVREYMDAPTTKSQGYSYYGLRNEGILVVCDNVETGINDIEIAYSNTKSIAESLFGISASDDSADLYQNILGLIQKLTAIDETFFNQDATITNYQSCLSSVLAISAEYLPVKQAFDGIFTDTELQGYMTGFLATKDLTFDVIDRLERYRRKTDKTNLQTIQTKIKQFLKTFANLIQRKTVLEQAIYDDGAPIKLTSGNELEAQLLAILEVLLETIVQRTTSANLVIDQYKRTILGYVDTISTEVSVDLDSYDNTLQEEVDQKLSSLNFFQHPIYNKYRGLMMFYGGQEFCYDPYYNIKNQTHPTYQIHPYLWNVVQKLPGQTLLESGFKSTVVDELEDANFSVNARKYWGDFGETINTWRAVPNGITDWSGYASRYERSSNATPEGVVNEVVDYDGIFYPPAVDEFLGATQASIASVSKQKTARKLASELLAAVDSRLAEDKVELSTLFALDESSGIISSQTVVQYGNASGILDAYVDSSVVNTAVDGAFVGTSISAVSRASLASALSKSIPTTFYEKYYQHLQLPTSQLEFIGQQLAEYKDIIREIATSKDRGNQLAGNKFYDIYKYGLDAQGNSYILLKNYDYSKLISYDKLTYKQKKNTLGELWVRLANHPIAFPAFYGSHPAYYIAETSQLNPSILHLANLTEDGITYLDPKTKKHISRINSRMCVFYDLELTQNQANIFLISYNADLGDSFDDFHNQFQFGWVIPNIVRTKHDSTRDLEQLLFLNVSNDGASQLERIDFFQGEARTQANRSRYAFSDDVDSSGNLLDLRWSLDLDKLSDGIRWPALVGYYVYDSSTIDFMYVVKCFQRSSGESELHSRLWHHADNDYTPGIFVIRIKNGSQANRTPTGSSFVSKFKLGSRIPVGDDVCVGFDFESMQVTLALQTRAAVGLSNVVAVKSTSNAVDFSENTEGSTIDDPLATEMNSHDVLNTNITLVNFTRNGGALFQTSLPTDHNINADISYIPSYPSDAHEIFFYSRYPDASYYNVELLGMSKDIDYQASLVNPSPNPHLDYDKICEDLQFGRVYEDYLKDYDKTYKLIANPSLNDNMVSQAGRAIEMKQLGFTDDGRSIGYQMTVHLDQLHDLMQYSEKDYKNIQVLMYNEATLGKNPYAISPLTSFIEKQELDYILNDKDTEDAEYRFNQDLDTTNEIKITGTRSTIGTSSKFDSNYIDNISKIECQFTLEDKCLDLLFHIEDPTKPAFVREGTFKILLYNPKDLTQFKYYHLLDAYGAVNCRYLPNEQSYAADQPDDGRGWGIFFDRSKHDNDDISSLIQSFYIDKYGRRTKLKDVELSDYDALSDVYCLRGTSALGFKYDDELHFAISSDLYYFPTLNVSYPKIAVDAVDGNKMLSRMDSELDVLRKMFNSRNLFVMSYESPSAILSAIGKVDIPILVDDTNDIRAFEDWLDVGDDGIANFAKYDAADPRAFRFVKFSSVDEQVVPSQLELDDETYVKSKSVEDFLDEVQKTNGVAPLKSEDYGDALNANDQVTIDFTPQTDSTGNLVGALPVDLSKLLRIYANYKKEQDGTITLYFNYFNYLDTPYIKIENNLLYCDTIDRTYLKLKSGEDGLLDIILQARYYVGDDVFGYANIKVLSYHIWNLSDDKPKFLIQKAYQIRKDSLHDQIQTASVYLTIPDVSVDLQANASVDIPLRLTSTKMLSSECKMTLMYPKNLLDYDTTQNSSGLLIDTSDDASGVLGVTITNPMLGEYSLRFITSDDALKTVAPNSIHSLGLDEFEMYDLSGYPCEVHTQYGKIYSIS